MNITLCQDIERELLTGTESDRIQEAVLQQEEGTIEVFVRYGRHQKTSPPPVSLLGNESLGGLHLLAYEDMVKTIVKALQKQDKEIQFGHLLIKYKATDEGDLEKLALLFKDVVLHNGNGNSPIN